MFLQRCKPSVRGSRPRFLSRSGRKSTGLRNLAGSLVIGLLVGFAGTEHVRAQPGGPTAQDPPVAQQFKNLQDEIKMLRDQIQELINRLARAEERISQLERQVRAGAQAAPPAGGQGTGDDDALAIPEDQPLASPEAAFRTVRDQYVEHFADLSFDGGRDRANYLRRVRQWVARFNRELTDQIEWTCEVHKVEMLQTGAAYVDVRIIDPQSGKPRSDIHVIEVPRRVALTIRRIRESPDKPIPYELSGIFRMQLEVDEDRIEEGVFQEPRFVGPFVNFGYELDVRSLSPVEEPPGSEGG